MLRPQSLSAFARSIVVVFLVLGLSGSAAAQFVTFSVDLQGPVTGGPDGFGGAPFLTEGDILTVTLPGPPGPNAPVPFPIAAPPGIELNFIGGGPGAYAGGLGLPGGSPFNELDALSYGNDFGGRLLFSVDEFAVGATVPGSIGRDVAREGAMGAREASADVFAYLGAIALAPLGPVFGNVQFLDGDGAPKGSLGLGLVEPNPPGLGLPDAGDNLDAFDYDTLGGYLSVGPIFFSLDGSFLDSLEGLPANSGTAAAYGFSGADVIGTFPGGAPFLSIPAAVLGLDLMGFGSDDLDALLFIDADSSLTLSAPDFILFSLRRDSTLIVTGTADSLLGLPIEEGDVLTVPFGGPPGAPPVGTPPAIYITAEALGLATVRSGSPGPFGADELDALDAHLRPTFSVDFQGPTVSLPAVDSYFAGPITSGDILTPLRGSRFGPSPPYPAALAPPYPVLVPPVGPPYGHALGPLPPPGTVVGAAPGAPGVVPGGLGIIAGGIGGFFELDALSYGMDRPGSLVFSVDEFAIGAPHPIQPVDIVPEGSTGGLEAAADVFEYLGPVAPSTKGFALGSRYLVDGDGIPAAAGNPNGGLGLVEPNPPVAGGLPDGGDNLDALDLDTTPAHIGLPIYFSLDSSFPDFIEPGPPVNNGTAAATGLFWAGIAFSGGDVLVSVGGGFPALAIPAPTLGLDLFGADTDDLDALIFSDIDGDMKWSPGIDTLYFSVRRGSKVIGMADSLKGIPIEEGDVLRPPALAGLTPEMLIPAERLGLLTVRSGAPILSGDELDALDMLPLPEPGAVTALGAGVALLFALARRKRGAGS